LVGAAGGQSCKVLQRQGTTIGGSDKENTVETTPGGKKKTGVDFHGAGEIKKKKLVTIINHKKNKKKKKKKKQKEKKTRKKKKEMYPAQERIVISEDRLQCREGDPQSTHTIKKGETKAFKNTLRTRAKKKSGRENCLRGGLGGSLTLKTGIEDRISKSREESVAGDGQVKGSASKK